MTRAGAQGDMARLGMTRAGNPRMPRTGMGLDLVLGQIE